MRVDRSLIVSIHDVAPPNWPQVKKILAQLTILGARKRSLLVIPNFRGRYRVDESHEFAEWLCERKLEGDEIILHGYEHAEVRKPQGLINKIKNRLYAQNEGEFWALTYEEAKNRIEAGMAILKNAGLQSTGFVAPAWLLNREGLMAARNLGFEYSNFYLTIFDLVNERSILAPSLVFGPGNINEDWSLLFHRMLSKLLIPRTLVRVVIHPPCVENNRRFSKILAIVKEQLLYHRPVTYFEFLTNWRQKVERSG
jgi:predicted deacetylase